PPPPTAASPAATPGSGPRPSPGARTISTSGGKGGMSGAGAATTTIGDTTSPRMRPPRGNMSSPPNGSHAFGRPIRLLRPPHRTTPETRISGPSLEYHAKAQRRKERQQHVILDCLSRDALWLYH